MVTTVEHGKEQTFYKPHCVTTLHTGHWLKITFDPALLPRKLEALGEDQRRGKVRNPGAGERGTVWTISSVCVLFTRGGTSDLFSIFSRIYGELVLLAQQVI